LHATKFEFNRKKNKNKMIHIDAKSIENMLVTSSIIICDNDIENQQKPNTL
jgi:hypothetical protein